MRELSSSEANLWDLGAIRTAAETRRAVERQAGQTHYFVHKWTKQRTGYAAEDLELPRTLYARGNSPRWDRRVIGAGGTRSPTVETFCLVAKIMRALAGAGSLIISGGVPGVDLAAHLAALDVKSGSTVAVLANPVDMGLRGHEWHSLPVETEILKNGAFLSEYTASCEVFSFEYCQRLLARDRIISGLCDVFLAFECNEDSATVDTAHRALLQGKRVICVESVGKSARRGIEQLRDMFGVSVLKERGNSASAIVARILESETAALQ